MTALACPGCGEPMRRERFERRPAGHVDVDLCHGCHAIWFDQYESVALAPGGVMALFGRIHEHSGAAWRALGERPACPRCRKRLAFTHDLQRTNRITYYRCPDGHGRLTTFFQFLREKRFVRSLTRPEVERLRAHVAQVRCSGCGAPVDLAVDAHCTYCRAPIAILDADAVKRTLAELTEQERRRTRVDPEGAVDALLAGQRVERALARAEGRARRGFGMDLVADALDLMMGSR